MKQPNGSPSFFALLRLLRHHAGRVEWVVIEGVEIVPEHVTDVLVGCDRFEDEFVPLNESVSCPRMSAACAVEFCAALRRFPIRSVVFGDVHLGPKGAHALA